MSLGPFAVAVAVVILLAGLAYLANSGRAPRTGAEVPPNLSPYSADGDLENRKLNRKLVAALFSSGFLALALPIYFLTESNRQSGFEHRFEEESIHRGEEAYLQESEENPHGFGCIRCHGAEGVGGNAVFVDPRTGATVSWKAPSLNDIFYRYDRDEVEYWLVWGRPGTPMPPWGLEAGGPMNDQQLEDLMNYLETVQVTQAEALELAEARVAAAVSELQNAPETIAEAITLQEVEIEAIETATARLAAAQRLFDTLTSILAEPDTGLDSDQDGLSDVAEGNITQVSAAAVAEVAFSNEEVDALTLALDAGDAFSTEDEAGEPVADVAAAEELLSHLVSAVARLSPVVENTESLLASSRQTRDNLLQAQEGARYQVNLTGAAGAFGGDLEAATRAYGLYTAYCARCHTAGYSAGPVATLEPGSGALGPSLREGRTLVQFPDRDEHIEFIVIGSRNGQPYGVNGIGRGWMPAFGTVLSQEDIELIVDYERSLQ
jgi:mono/diheme cytochrome c family protein